MLTVIRPLRLAAEADSDSGSDALRVVAEVSDWLADATADAAQRRDTPALLRRTRDRALVLLLFWRRVSAAELVGVRIENVKISPGLGLTCDVGSPSGWRQANWRPIAVPALRHLCPVGAVRLWLALAGIDSGPLFPRIERDGLVARDGLPADSVLQLLLALVERSCAGDATDPIDIGRVHAARQERGR